MLSYRSETVPTALEPWPFEGAESNYKILRGAPSASGRFDLGASTDARRLGVWHCTAGAFECTELGDELQTILSGRVRIVAPDGTASEFGPGDSFFTRRGERLIWDVIEDVTKVFYSLNEDALP